MEGLFGCIKMMKYVLYFMTCGPEKFLHTFSCAFAGHTSSVTLDRGSINSLELGMKFLIQLAAQTKCCNSDPVLGSEIASRAVRRRGCKRNPSSLMRRPHKLTFRRKNLHLPECSLRPFCPQREKNFSSMFRSSASDCAEARMSSNHWNKVSRREKTFCMLL